MARHARPPSRAGFTLMELIVVMVVTGILAVTVLPRFNLLRGFGEAGFRDQLKATLEYARKSAVAQRRHVRVTVAADTVSVHISSDAPEGAGATSYDRALTLPGRQNHQITVPDGITLAPAGTLAFTPLGRSAGAVYTITGDETYTVTVVAETGHVH